MRLSRERMERLLLESLGAYSPSGQEGAAVDLFAAFFQEHGVPFERLPVDGKRTNLIVRLGPRPAALCLVGHLDTIARDDEDPDVRRDGDVVHALGAADMKSGCAAMAEVVAALAESGDPWSAGVILALVVGEEEDGAGAEALVANGALDAPLTVIGEPTGLAACAEHYGYLELALTGEGARAHAALPEAGANAIHATVEWVDALTRGVARLDGSFASVRRIEGGGELFVVADHCEAHVDVHLPPGATADPVAALLEHTRKEIQQGHPGVTLTAEPVFFAGGYAFPGDDPRLSPVREALRARGRLPELTTFRSHSDGPVLLRAPTLPVICGPGRLEVAHTPEEHVSLTETWEAAELYAAMVDGACRS